MGKKVYVETSIASYLAAAPSRDVRAMAWQQITAQWWLQERPKYTLYASELVLVEAARGDAAAARPRLTYLRGIHELRIDERTRLLAERLIAEEALPRVAEVDALHVAVATVHAMDYLLTWNCRHIDNATLKPRMRTICARAGYACPEICTPLELLKEDTGDAS
jgi:hypothetical protein